MLSLLQGFLGCAIEVGKRLEYVNSPTQESRQEAPPKLRVPASPRI